MPNRESRVRVLVVFALCGGLAAASSVLKHLFSQHPDVDFLAAASIAKGIITSPSVFFAGAMLLAGFAVLDLGYLPRHMRFSAGRVAGGVLTAALAYPVGVTWMILILIASPLALMEPVNSDVANPPPVPLWRHLLSEGGLYIALLAGGILTVWVMALAFRIASQHWPPRIWLSALAVALGVPAVTVIAGYKYWRTPDLLFIEPSLGGIPPVLLIGELALAVVVGHWLYATAARAST